MREDREISVWSHNKGWAGEALRTRLFYIYLLQSTAKVINSHFYFILEIVLYLTRHPVAVSFVSRARSVFKKHINSYIHQHCFVEFLAA